MKLGLKNILGVTIGALGTTYFAGKLVDSVKKIIAKDEPTVVEEPVDKTKVEETAE